MIDSIKYLVDNYDENLGRLLYIKKNNLNIIEKNEKEKIHIQNNNIKNKKRYC